MPEGQNEVKLVVKDLMDRGGVGFTYRLIVKPAETAFQLALNDEQVAIPRGGTALIPVTIARGGYQRADRPRCPGAAGGRRRDGSLASSLPVRPAAWSVSRPIRPADSTRGTCRSWEGTSGQAVAASRTIVFAQQTISTPGFGMAGTIPSYWRPFVSLTAAVTRPGPIAPESGEAKLVVPQGSTVEVPVQVVRDGAAKAKYQLAALAPPTGLSVAESEIGESTTSAAVKVTAAADAPLGPLMLGLVATPAGLKDAGPPRRVSVAAAMIPVEVVRPAGRK